LAHKVLLVDYNSNLYTQNDNQFIWFADRDNNEWLSSGATRTSDYTYPSILGSNYNFGTTGTSTVNSPLFKVVDIFGDNDGSNDLLCAVFPYLPDVNNFIENGQDKVRIIKPQVKFNIGLKIFFKFKGDASATDDFVVAGSSPSTKSRKIKFWFETNDNTNYQFVINFNLNRFRSYLKPITETTYVS